MKDIRNEYKSFLDDIEKRIKNEDDLNYIKLRFSQFVNVVIDKIDYIVDYKNEELEKLEESQKQIEENMAQMQQIINNIEKDIYVEDGFDFEIVCPYCNEEFVIDMDENKKEVECPKCNNIIELDWSGDLSDEKDDGCNGSCHGCHGCGSEDEDDM